MVRASNGLRSLAGRDQAERYLDDPVYERAVRLEEAKMTICMGHSVKQRAQP
jgi:hypothetical protein